MSTTCPPVVVSFLFLDTTSILVLGMVAKLALTADELQLRDEVRVSRRPLPQPSELPHALDERIAYLRRWQVGQREAGFVGRAWPAEFGGGAVPRRSRSSSTRSSRRRAPELSRSSDWTSSARRCSSSAATSSAGGTFGPSSRRTRSGVRVFRARGWPDLASLRTRAVETDEDTVSTVRRPGSRGTVRALVWRARPHRPGRAEAPRHLTPHRGPRVARSGGAADGADHRSRGVRLFFDDVLVPKENLLGEPGQGWRIAMHVVAHERGTAALPRQVTLRTWLDRLVADASRPP